MCSKGKAAVDLPDSGHKIDREILLADTSYVKDCAFRKEQKH
ncbi:hypothetical protein [Bacillus tequilensis]|nr:hypothetical protein [Bacillus tequilensis]SPU01376.1 Uncharacterised protein [Bacillus tequilensis]